MNSYEDYLKEQENSAGTFQKLFEKIKPNHIMLFAALVLIGNQITKNNGGNNKSTLIIIVIVGAIYLFSIVKQNKEHKAIPRSIAQEIARKDLLKEINSDSSYVHGTKVIPTGVFKDQVWDSGDGPKLFKYNFGFKIKEPDKPASEIIYQMNPFSGECKGVTEVNLGFSGEDVKDIQQIFPEKILKKEEN